jgi:hypothetical protein
VPGERHLVVSGADFVVKFERHGEFVSWQVNRPLQVDTQPDDAALRAVMQDASAVTRLPDAFVAELGAADSGRMIAAAHVVMLHAHDSDEMLRRCRTLLAAQAGPIGSDDAAPLMGAFIGDARRAALLTHLGLGRDGFTRFVVLDFGLPPDQAAREAQRLCEIEAYRMLAMLSFPLAQREATQLAQLEQALQGTVDAMANDSAHDDAQAFEALTRLAAEVEHRHCAHPLSLFGNASLSCHRGPAPGRPARATHRRRANAVGLPVTPLHAGDGPVRQHRPPPH